MRFEGFNPSLTVTHYGCKESRVLDFTFQNQQDLQLVVYYT